MSIEESDYFKDVEDKFKNFLNKKQYAILRVDGKNFSKLTKEKFAGYPFDENFNLCMKAVAQKLLQEVQGAIWAYVQSDEVSVCFSDKNKENSELWFGGNVQKIVSVSAAQSTTSFMEMYSALLKSYNFSISFDARCFSLPDVADTHRYMTSRQINCIRNASSMLAGKYFSHKELMGKSGREKISMCVGKELDWDNMNKHNKYGTLYFKKEREIICISDSNISSHYLKETQEAQ